MATVGPLLEMNSEKTIMVSRKFAFGDQETFRGIAGLDFQGKIDSDLLDISISVPAYLS